jgi:nucleotide-binding universal stress UspA family protein
MAFQKILVATDLSDIAARACGVAGELASKVGAKLVVMSVVDVRGLTVGATELDTYIDVGAIHAGMEKSTTEAMPGFIEKAGVPEGVEVETIVRQGIPVDAIIDTARETGADLIVIGTHGRTGFSHLFFGSVAEKVVRLAHMPVLTVGPEEREEQRG